VAAAPATTAAPSEAVAAATPAAPAAPVAPPPPERLAPYVEAAVTRKKIPYFVIPVLVLLPIWALMYALTLDKPSPKEAGPLIEGATVYAKCAACHGPTGGGGVGPQLSGGAVLKEFPNAADQLDWVMLGSAGFKAAGRQTYGTQNKSVDAGIMPGWADSLTAEELVAVVRHERETLSGEEVDAAALKKQYEAMQKMIDENFPDRSAEFKAVFDEWANLPPES